MSATTKTLRSCIEYCQDLLASSSGAEGGRVHTRERLVRTLEELLNVAGKRNETDDEWDIHGWTIAIESDGQDPEDTPEGTNTTTFHRNYIFVFRGFFGLDDEAGSGDTWQDILESVENAFDADPKLGDFANHTMPIAGRIRDQHREYGTILVHYCELTLTVRLRRDRLS